MKKCIFQVAIGDKPIYKKSSDSVRKYCNKHDIEYIVKTNNDYVHPALNKLYIGELLKTYDKVLYIDSDIIVSENAPNFFEKHNKNRLYILDEYSQWLFNPLPETNYKIPLIHNMKSLISNFFNYEWKSLVYYNTGVMLFNKSHKKIFKEFNVLLWQNNPELRTCYEQTYFNYIIDKLKIKIQSLNYDWNHMIINNNDWDNEKSYFKHYTNGIAKKKYI
jgi:lipopolysaccharide biosynthesis glycosyltransferase